MEQKVEETSWSGLTAAQIDGIARLWFEIWPKPNLTAKDYAESLQEASPERPQRRFHLILHGSGVIAVAETFAREINHADGPMTVMALASVCSSTARRGQGLGRAVTRSALERVDRGEFPLSLFQTPVPAFYARLGARTVENRFYNSRAPRDPQANPFWDPHIMIYPATAAWPNGPIDLGGPGY